MDAHWTAEHPDVNTVAAVQQYYEATEEKEDFMEDMVALNFLRRMSFHKQNELDTGFSMVMSRKYFAKNAVVDGVVIEQAMVAGEVDVISVTVEDPNVYNKWLGTKWWWKQREDREGNWLRAFVLFGDRELQTPEKDELGAPIFQKVVDKCIKKWHTLGSSFISARLS